MDVIRMEEEKGRRLGSDSAVGLFQQRLRAGDLKELALHQPLYQRQLGRQILITEICVVAPRCSEQLSKTVVVRRELPTESDYKANLRARAIM
jgi:hypothetical protein